MKGFFRRLFNIYPGEENNAFLFATLGFLWALGVTLGQKYADALFLLHVGATSLPYAYIITACALMVTAAFFLKMYHHVPIHRIFAGVLMTGIAFYLVVFFYLSLNLQAYPQELWFTLKIFGSMLFLLSFSCFWTFIDQYFHLQDAKRLYSLLSSAVFLGIATTGFVMRSGVIGFHYLTLIIIGLLLISVYLTNRIAEALIPIHEEHAVETRGTQSDTTFRFLVQSVMKSPFTLLLMIGNFLVFLYIVTTEYNYLSAFDHYFDPGTTLVSGQEQNAHLTIFLGQAIATVSIINLLFGLFVYSPLVRRFGVSNLLLITPIFLTVTYIGWINSSTLLFPLMGFFVVEGMIYIIDDNNFTLLLNAVPSKVKYKIRLIIESFFEPVGMLLSSLLLTFAPAESLKLGLTLALCALTVALLLRGQYLKAIYLNLSENAIHFNRKITDWFVGLSKKERQKSERRMLAILYRGDEQAQLMAIRGLLDLNNPYALKRLLKRIPLLSTKGKIAFVELLDRVPLQPPVIELMQKWVERSEDPQLTLAIQQFFVKREILSTVTPAAEKEPSGAELIAMLRSTTDSEVRQTCLRALGKTNDFSLVTPIITSSTHFRPNERRLTESILMQWGKAIVPTLLTITKNTALHDRCRVLAGKVLGQLAPKELRIHLFDIVRAEIDRAFFYYYYAHTIQTKYPEVDLTVLTDALLSSFHSVVDFIIQLLGVAGESEDCELLSRSLRSANPKVRSHVLETLERSCETPIFRALYPLIADVPQEHKLHHYERSGHVILGLPELLDTLSASSMQGDRLIAVFLKYRLDLPMTKDDEGLFQDFAYELFGT